jgi:hypothetical protein
LHKVRQITRYNCSSRVHNARRGRWSHAQRRGASVCRQLGVRPQPIQQGSPNPALSVMNSNQAEQRQ